MSFSFVWVATFDVWKTQSFRCGKESTRVPKVCVCVHAFVHVHFVCVWDLFRNTRICERFCQPITCGRIIKANISALQYMLFLGMCEYPPPWWIASPWNSSPSVVLLPASHLSPLRRTGGDSVYYGMSKKGQTSHTHLGVYCGKGQRCTQGLTRDKESHTVWKTQTKHGKPELCVVRVDNNNVWSKKSLHLQRITCGEILSHIYILRDA